MPLRTGRCDNCCGECLIFRDNYNRDDDSDLGADWDTTDFAITGNLAVTTTDNAIAECLTDHPDGIAGCKVTIQYQSADPGTEIRCLVNWNVAGGTYHYSQLKIGTTYHCLSLHAQDGSILARRSISAANKGFQTYFGRGRFAFAADGEWTCVDVEEGDGDSFGMATGNVEGTLELSLFIASKYYHPDTAPECDSASCPGCELYTTPVGGYDSVPCDLFDVDSAFSDDSDELITTGANKKLVILTPQTGTEITQSISVDVTLTSTNEEVVLWLAMAADGSGGEWAKVKKNGAGTSLVCALSTGETTTVFTGSILNPMTLTLCMANNYLVLLRGSTVLLNSDDATETGRYGGVGSGANTGTVRIHTIRFHQCGGCTVVCAGCATGTAPRFVFVEIDGVENPPGAAADFDCCPDYNGGYVCPYDGETTTCEWTMFGTFPNQNCLQAHFANLVARVGSFSQQDFGTAYRFRVSAGPIIAPPGSSTYIWGVFCDLTSPPLLECDVPFVFEDHVGSNFYQTNSIFTTAYCRWGASKSCIVTPL